MIDSLSKRGGAEEVSPPTRDALVRKRTSAATSTDLPNLSTFYLCLLLPCMSLTAMHASHCHACLSLPCMPSTAMHVRTFRHWQLFFYAMSTVLLRCPFLPLPPTAVYLPLPYTSHCHACQDIPTENV
jgi:hypothetical protein